MRDVGGGGGYGGTNWNGVSMIDMWLAVGNQATEPHWQLLTGWRRTYELTLQHMAAVKTYRENLAAAWPPEKSPASAAYLQRLDELLANLRQTYDAAVANHGAFHSATLALSSARTDLRKVADEYFANEGKLARFEEERAARPPVGRVRAAEPKPPVEAVRQEQLTAEARSIMYRLSTELIQARAQIARPPVYLTDDGISDHKDARAGSDYVAPPIPEVIPMEPQSGTSGTAPKAATLQPAAHAGHHAANSSAERHPGLVLGGLNASVGPAAFPDIHTNPSTSLGSAGADQGSPSFPPTVAAPIPPSVTGNAATAGRRAVEGTMRAAPTANPGYAAKAIPPGGVIGPVPGGAATQPVSGSRGPQRVNPVGGLIAPGTASITTGARTSTVPGIPLASPSGLGTPNGGGGKAREKWDPDNPWATPEGVPPVVRPAAEQHIDPGPAIGLA